MRLSYISEISLVILIVVISGVGFTIFPQTTRAVGGIPYFGGRVTLVEGCDEGILATVITTEKDVLTFMYDDGFSAQKQFGPPTHPGQLVLGNSLGASTCTIDGEPIGSGPLVMPNAGSSLQ